MGVATDGSQEMRKTLITRGEKFMSLLGIYHQWHSGTAYREDGDKIKRYTVEGRIMLDHDNFRQSNPGHSVATVHPRNDIAADEISEQDLLVASPTVLGFSFDRKRWFAFSVTDVEELGQDKAALDALQLEHNSKQLLEALVKSHRSGPLIMALHGPTGVGKSFTTEAVAAALHRPLYFISPDELSNTYSLEGAMQDVLDLMHAWNAIVVIDHADDLLKARQHDDYNNNETRALLYFMDRYRGVLFLLCSSTCVIDSACASRITRQFAYRALTPAARQQIWNRLLDDSAEEGDKISRSGVTAFEAADMERLGSYRLDGHQVCRSHAFWCSTDQTILGFTDRALRAVTKYTAQYCNISEH